VFAGDPAEIQCPTWSGRGSRCVPSIPPPRRGPVGCEVVGEQVLAVPAGRIAIVASVSDEVAYRPQLLYMAVHRPTEHRSAAVLERLRTPSPLAFLLLANSYQRISSRAAPRSACGAVVEARSEVRPTSAFCAQ